MENLQKSKKIVFSRCFLYISTFCNCIGKIACRSALLHNSYFPLTGIWIYREILLLFQYCSNTVTWIQYCSSCEINKIIKSSHQAFHGEASLHSTLFARTPDSFFSYFCHRFDWFSHIFPIDLPASVFILIFFSFLPFFAQAMERTEEVLAAIDNFQQKDFSPSR